MKDIHNNITEKSLSLVRFQLGKVMGAGTVCKTFLDLHLNIVGSFRLIRSYNNQAEHTIKINTYNVS